LNSILIKTVGTSWVTVGDVGKAEDANQIQYNVVRVDGQRSSYIPIMKKGGDTNTIAVVDGVRALIGHLFDIPKQMTASLVPSAESAWIVHCSGQPPISKASCSTSKLILTIIGRIAHGWDDHRRTHRLGRSPTANLIDGNLTAEACIKHR